MIFNSIILLFATTLATPLLDKRAGIPSLGKEVYQNSIQKKTIHIGAATMPNYGCPQGKWKAGLLCYPNGEKTLLHPTPMHATCPDGKSHRAGLCYTVCPSGWDDGVSDCYQKCSGAFSTDCGRWCSKSNKDCNQLAAYRSLA